MDKTGLINHLEKLDAALRKPTVLYIYGSAAYILLDEPERTSLDMDVAGPYSRADMGDLRQAAEKAGLPLNPDSQYQGDHLEWVSVIRLCLAKPDRKSDIVLWQGEKLTLKTASVPGLIASKLIRYDEIDQADVQYLCRHGKVSFESIKKAAGKLPPPFKNDMLVLENLDNLKKDMHFWGMK